MFKGTITSNFETKPHLHKRILCDPKEPLKRCIIRCSYYNQDQELYTSSELEKYKVNEGIKDLPKVDELYCCSSEHKTFISHTLQIEYKYQFLFLIPITILDSTILNSFLRFPIQDNDLRFMDLMDYYETLFSREEFAYQLRYTIL